MLSIVSPVYNEAGNIHRLCASLHDTLSKLGRHYEVILVNDGSVDSSAEELSRATTEFPCLKVIELRRNSGQTAAIMAGIDHAQGDVLVFIDADLQNDPEDIPILLEKLNEGFDVVSGWRKERKDAKVRRNFVSRVANAIISHFSGVRLHDYGCTLKAYRRDVIGHHRLYGEMHRFIPIYASWMGAKVAEVPVRHHEREVGHSKYGLERVFKVVLDLAVVMFIDRYFVKPIYVFGGFGLFSLGVSLIAFIAMLVLKFAYGISMIVTPLPLFSAMTLLVGVISIFMGLLAEILVRVYFESQQRTIYSVRSVQTSSIAN